MAASLRCAAEDLGAGGLSVLVAGDFNVGERDAAKNGTNLANDTNDGYDDTRALLSDGLVDGLRMRSLTAHIAAPTYNSARFAASGPIDALYVAGPAKDRFTPAERTAITYGSDHFGLTTTLP